jgi:3-hydroxyacyl-CoA dehydrogenase
VIIASSSSGLTMSEIQKGAASHPERCVIAHPFNPPHLIPMVEIVGGAKTSETTIRRSRILHLDRAADGAPQQGDAGPRRQPLASRTRA